MCSRGTFLTDDENEKRCSAPQPAGECVGMSQYAEKLYGAKAPLGPVVQKQMRSVYTKMKRGEVSGETLALVRSAPPSETERRNESAQT